MTFEYPTDDDPISDEWWAPLLAVEARMGESDGSYRRLESLAEGIDGVGLRELPRFRPDRGMTSHNHMGKEGDVGHRGP